MNASMNESISTPETPNMAKENKPTFEQALKRLEEIIRALEGSSFSLENMVQLYDEANELIAMCTQELLAASKKVEVIRQERGAAESAPLDPEDPS